MHILLFFDDDGLVLYFKVYLSDIEYKNDSEDKSVTVEKIVDGVLLFCKLNGTSFVKLNKAIAAVKNKFLETLENQTVFFTSLFLWISIKYLKIYPQH